MSIQLRPDEALEVIMRLTGGENPRPDQTHNLAYLQFKEDLERITERMGEFIASETRTCFGDANFQGMEFAGLCVPISPRHEGQQIPDALKGIDDEGWDQ